MGRRIALLSLLVGLSGCELITQALAMLSDIELLGVIPADGFSDVSSPDYGHVAFSIGGRDDLGAALAPVADELEVVSDDGQDVETTPVEDVEGHDAGSFVLLVDGSGSTEADLYCESCPTDPNRLRVEAAKAMADEIAACGGGWQMSLMEFGGPSSGSYSVTNVLADWTSDAAAVSSAADALGSYTTTPLWDSVYETLDTLGEAQPVDDADADAWGRGIVVVSDGEDNVSLYGLDDVVAHANALGLRVHTIGFGPASDSVDSPSNGAVDGLRELAEQTGGTYGFVDSVDDLPALTAAMGGAMCSGYTVIDGSFDQPAASGERVTGKLRLKSAHAIQVPFTFRAP